MSVGFAFGEPKTREVGLFPTRISEITPELLSRALSVYAPGTKIERFEVVDTFHGFTTLLRLRIEINDTGRKAGIGPTIMLKAGFEPHSSQEVFRPSYAMEVVGARDVWPHLGLRTPVYYFADLDERGHSLILMEDLKARGAAFCDVFKPQGYNEVARRMEALARVHAETWDSPSIKPGGRFHDKVIGNGSALMVRKHTRLGSFTPEGWRAWTDLPRGAASSAKFKDLDWMLAAFNFLGRIADEIPNAIVHGDCHQGNLYTDKDGEPGFFDSLPRREPPFFELGYMMTCAMDAMDRKQFDYALLKVYADEARRCGVNTSYDEILHYYRIFLFNGWMFFIVNANEFQTEWFNTLHASRFNQAMFDHGTYELISSLM
jgi:hypothetical protein